ncbi:MAG: hypothetical protein KKF68_02935 [Nanoarchaeota archaeon]|nr:hypothetical protein [Nanoarchaeota archaeon]
MDRKRFSLFKIILETFSELILIFTAAAAGVSIGQRGHLMKSEWILATFLILISILLKTINRK